MKESSRQNTVDVVDVREIAGEPHQKRLPLKSSFVWCNCKLTFMWKAIWKLCKYRLNIYIFFCCPQVVKCTNVPYICHLGSFFKIMPLSAFFFFLPGVLFLPNRFFWYYPNETPFTVSMETVTKLSSFFLTRTKNLEGGSATVRDIFKQHVASFKGGSFSVSAGLWILLSKHSICRRRRKMN